MREVEKLMPPDITLVCKLDRNGYITFVNKDYVDISGYSEKELLGQSHEILQHPAMPAVVRKYVWDMIAENKHSYFISKNLTKNKEVFWTIADINPMQHKEWKSVVFIRRKFLPSDIKSEFEKLYETLYQIETQGGGEKVAQKYLDGWLEEREAQNISDYIIDKFGGPKKLKAYLTSEISDEELFTVDASELSLDEILKKVKQKKRRFFL